MTEKQEIAVIVQKEVQPLVVIAEKMTIVDAGSMEKAVEALSRLNQIHDRIEAEKDKVLGPLLEATKAEKARWKPVESLYEEAISIIRGKMSVYQTAETKRIKEEEARIAARVGAGRGKLKIETAVEKIENIDRVDKKVVTGSGLVKFRTDQKLKIVDETKIPREYLVVDEKKVLADLKAGKKVAGAEIEEVQVPVNYR